MSFGTTWANALCRVKALCLAFAWLHSYLLEPQTLLKLMYENVQHTLKVNSNSQHETGTAEQGGCPPHFFGG